MVTVIIASLARERIGISTLIVWQIVTTRYYIPARTGPLAEITEPPFCILMALACYQPQTIQEQPVQAYLGASVGSATPNRPKSRTYLAVAMEVPWEVGMAASGAPLSQVAAAADDIDLGMSLVPGRDR